MKTKPFCMGDSAVSSASGSTSCRCALVYYCCLLFPRLEARPAPELIGLWSRVNSRALAA